MFDMRGPKDQDPTKIMGQKDPNPAKWGGGCQKLNKSKMAVTKIELGVKQRGQKDRASFKGGGGRIPLVKSAEHTHTLVNI